MSGRTRITGRPGSTRSMWRSAAACISTVDRPSAGLEILNRRRRPSAVSTRRFWSRSPASGARDEVSTPKRSRRIRLTASESKAGGVLASGSRRWAIGRRLSCGPGVGHRAAAGQRTRDPRPVRIGQCPCQRRSTCPAASPWSPGRAVPTASASPRAGLLAELGAAVMVSATTDRIEARAGELRAAGFDAPGSSATSPARTPRPGWCRPRWSGGGGWTSWSTTPA